MIGKTLGPYKIIEQLGAGGMGEVYLGEDTRLGRKVAIKVLPEEYASDPERLARFEQEARTAAALNHPHIAVVHDIGTEGDIHFMVQEYLEGQSLRERLDKGALALDKALDLGIEVGEALIAAHKAGIVHRDLKPDNIFVTEEGHAKVLDFGLAKLTEMAAPAGGSASMSPTMLGTVAGQVMGTAGYMAPEQAAGSSDIDHRADLFAIGCVLQEMVTGSQPFAGRSVAETLSKIQHESAPSLVEMDPSRPAELHRITNKSMAKEPERRYQGATDLVVDLRALLAEVESGRGRGRPLWRRIEASSGNRRRVVTRRSHSRRRDARVDCRCSSVRAHRGRLFFRRGRHGGGFSRPPSPAASGRARPQRRQLVADGAFSRGPPPSLRYRQRLDPALGPRRHRPANASYPKPTAPPLRSSLPMVSGSPIWAPATACFAYRSTVAARNRLPIVSVTTSGPLHGSRAARSSSWRVSRCRQCISWPRAARRNRYSSSIRRPARSATGRRRTCPTATAYFTPTGTTAGVSVSTR